MWSSNTAATEAPPSDLASPTDTVIGTDFQTLSAEEQESQREEWKAELKKAEEEILTLRQVLASKESHAQGLKRRLGITAWREFSEDMNQGLKKLQESPTYKQTSENLMMAREIAIEKTTGIWNGITNNPAVSNFSRKATDAYQGAKTKISCRISQENFDQHNGTPANDVQEKTPQ